MINLKIESVRGSITEHALNEIKNKIKSIQIVHDKLTLDKNIETIEMSEYLFQLTGNIINSKENKTFKIKLNSDLVSHRIKVKDAIPLGIIFAEFTLGESLRRAGNA